MVSLSFEIFKSVSISLSNRKEKLSASLLLRQGSLGDGLWLYKAKGWLDDNMSPFHL